jgi:hypothetical protein
VGERKRWKPEEADAEFIRVGLEPIDPHKNIHTVRQSRCMTCGEVQGKSLQMITQYNYGCVYCNGKRVRQSDAEALLSERHGRPLEPFRGSHKPWRVQCTRCNREYVVAYHVIQREGRKGFCKPCAGLSLEMDHILAVMRAAWFEPLEPYVNSVSAWRCRCLVCDEEVSPSFGNVQNGHGCLYCERKRLGISQRKPPSIEEVRARNIEPLEPFPGRGAQWKCRCLKCGREVTPRWNSILTNGGDGCIKCGARARGDRQFRNEKEVVAEMLAAGIKPLGPYPGSSEPWRCECQRCGKIVMTRYMGIQRGERGCLDCGNTSSAATRTLPAEVAEQFMRDAGYEPLEPYKKSGVQWRCIHTKCGNEVTPSYSTIKSGDGGCKTCADNGIDYTAPAILYLMRSDSFFSLKIGITATNSVRDRVAHHQRFGWEVETTWQVRDGFLAEEIEQKLIKYWRQVLGAPPSVRKEDMPQGGYTETASLLHAELEETQSLVESLLLEAELS